MDFGHFETLINETYSPEIVIHGRMHNKRMLPLLPRLIAFFQANRALIPQAFHHTLDQLDPAHPPEAWLMVFAMRASGRWQNGTYIDEGHGKDFAEAGMHACWWELRKRGYSAAVAPRLAKAIVECEWHNQAPETLLGFLLKMATTMETLRDTTPKTVKMQWFPAWEYVETAEQKNQLTTFVLDHYAYIARTQGFYHVSLVDGEDPLVAAHPSALTKGDTYYFLHQNAHFRCAQATLDDMDRQAHLRRNLPVDLHGATIKAARKHHKSSDGKLKLDTLCKELQSLGYVALFSAQQTWSWVLSVMMTHLNNETRPACKVSRAYDPRFPVIADDRGHTAAIASLPDDFSMTHNPDFYFPGLHISASSTMAPGPATECAQSMLEPKYDEYRPIQHIATPRAFQEEHFVQPLIAAGWCEDTAWMCSYEIIHIMQQAGLPPQKALQVFFVHQDDPVADLVMVAEPYGWLSPDDTQDAKALWDVIAEADANQQFRINATLPAFPMVRDYGPGRQHFRDLKAQVIACLDNWHRYADHPPKVTDLPLLRQMLLMKDLQNTALNGARQTFLQRHICHIRSVGDTGGQEVYQAATTAYFAAISEQADMLKPIDVVTLLRSGDLCFCPADRKSAIVEKLASDTNLLIMPHEFVPYVGLINRFDIVANIVDRYFSLMSDAAVLFPTGLSGVTFTRQDFTPLFSRLLALADKPEQIPWDKVTDHVAPDKHLTKWVLSEIKRHFPMLDFAVQQQFLNLLSPELAAPFLKQCLTQANQDLPPGLAVGR